MVDTMKQYKFIAVDMDGTLLNSQKEITPNTLNSINKMIDKGYIFCLSTGRSYAGVSSYLEKINGNIPLILYNGSVVTFSKTNELLINKVLSSNQAHKILDIINKNNGTYIFWSKEKLFVNELNNYTEKYFKMSNVIPHIIKNESEIPYEDITKIIWFDENEKLKLYQNTILKELYDVNYFTSQPTFLEFVSYGISKANAMEALGKYYNISNDEMIAVGDGCNDLQMIQYAALGVAMANAEQEVIDNANYVTTSNNEDGVAKVIDKFILNK